MKLAIIFPTLNQQDLTHTAVDCVMSNLGVPRDVIVLDNNSEVPYEARQEVLVSLNKNIGVYPAFWEALKHTDADIIAFFHTDLFVEEKGWDERVVKQFEDNPKLGLIGFIGSNEIDAGGGRGYGTTSNFQGMTTGHRNKRGEDKQWIGSPAKAHGRADSGFSVAAVVDGCAMIFRRAVLEQIKQRANFPPHHFYDRLLSSETREAGWSMGVLGIMCDHISGQTVNQEPAYNSFAEQWATTHGFTKGDLHNWDSVLYKEAERQWLTEYRDIKHLVPCHV